MHTAEWCGRVLRTLWRRRDGIALVELAVVAPIFVTGLILTVDVARAIHAKQQLVAAVAAGAQYAFVNGSSSSSDVSGYLTKIKAVITSATTLAIPSGGISATYNNASDSTNASKCYCISGSGASVTYTVTSCGTSCYTHGPTAGAYVAVAVTYSFTPLFPFSTPYLPSTLKENAVMRVQ